MRFDRNTKYNTYALLALIVAAFTGILISFTIHADDVARLLWQNVVLFFAPIFLRCGHHAESWLPVVRGFLRKANAAFRKEKERKKESDDLGHPFYLPDRNGSACPRGMDYYSAVFGAL